MALDPTFFSLEKDVRGEGIGQGDLHKILYNLHQAILAIAENIDADGGVIGSDYASLVSTPLDTAHAVLRTPVSGDTET